MFEEGERVRCLIISVDQESQRIGLSTADLEETTGDMLMDKVSVAAARSSSQAHGTCANLCNASAQ